MWQDSKEESAPWTIRWAAAALSLHMVYFLTARHLAWLLDALSYIQYERSAINPAFTRLIIFRFCWHVLSNRCRFNFAVRLSAETVDQCEGRLFWRKLVKITRGTGHGLFQYTYRHKGRVLLMQTPHVRDGGVCFVSTQGHIWRHSRQFHSPETNSNVIIQTPL